jgi:hypothetical protein
MFYTPCSINEKVSKTHIFALITECIKKAFYVFYRNKKAQKVFTENTKFQELIGNLASF